MSLSKKYSQAVALLLVPKVNPKIRKEGAFATILYLLKLFSPHRTSAFERKRKPFADLAETQAGGSR
jgi:hypothetical protein